MNILVALLIFTVIVVIHELGHFLLAKSSKVGVPEFSVGMGPRIVTFAKTPSGLKVRFFCSQKKFDESEDWKDVTKYSCKILPLGGSCAMVGEDEEDDSEDSFNSKGVLPRFLIVFAGPFFNFILAFVFSIIILGVTGIDYPIVEYVFEGQPAAEAGLKQGDVITAINDKNIMIGREIETYKVLHPLTGKPVKVEFIRDGKKHSATINPNYESSVYGFSYDSQNTGTTKIVEVSKKSAFEKAGIKKNDYICAINGIEIKNSQELSKTIAAESKGGKEIVFTIERNGLSKEYKVKPDIQKVKTLGFRADFNEKKKSNADVVIYSFVEVKYWIETTVASLGQLITGKVSTNDISGPVGIVNTVGDVIEQSSSQGLKIMMMNILYMSVLLSANLGVMNLLPLPALDGGRLVFIIIEAIRRKPIDRTKEGYVHFAGFVLLMLFMIFVMYHDIIKIIG